MKIYHTPKIRMMGEALPVRLSRKGENEMHNERLTLATICSGALQEKIDRAFEKVANNILDPNTDPGKKRSITLKMVFKPDENDREDVEVTSDVSVSLAPEVGVATRFYVNKDLENDRVTVMEHKKGEIKGQLDFSDLGFDMDVSKRKDYDPETGEITGDETASAILDFRKNA